MKRLIAILLLLKCSMVSASSLPVPENNVQRILVFGDDKPIAFSECSKESYLIYVVHQNIALVEK